MEAFHYEDLAAGKVDGHAFHAKYLALNETGFHSFTTFTKFAFLAQSPFTSLCT